VAWLSLTGPWQSSDSPLLEDISLTKDPKQQFFKNTSWTMLEKSAWRRHLGGTWKHQGDILEAQGSTSGHQGAIRKAPGDTEKHPGVTTEPPGTHLRSILESF